MRSDANTQSGYDQAVVTATLDWLFSKLAAERAAPLLVGLSGLQGSGKSTFARQLADAAQRCGVSTQVLALDHFYLGRRERQRLARDVHLLLATRGVPGTHDLDLLQRTLDALAVANPDNPARIPHFDKGRDTRVPPSRWRAVDSKPQIILLEGWCVGVPAQDAQAIALPLNALEREDDNDGLWRNWVNAQLADRYTLLWRRLDWLVVLEAPEFAVVTRWRDQQEHPLRLNSAPHAMGRAALRRFLMHYERLSRHALRELPELAGLRIALRNDRSVRRMTDCTTAT